MTYDSRARIVQKVGAGLTQSRQNQVYCLHTMHMPSINNQAEYLINKTAMYFLKVFFCFSSAISSSKTTRIRIPLLLTL
jgi:hypothetical protein